MNIEEITQTLKEGNTEKSLAALKDLFASSERAIGKELFELVYDLRFSTNAELKFWAKKILDKYELKSRAVEEREKAAAMGYGPVYEEVPVEKLIEKLYSQPESLVFDDIKRICEAKDPKAREGLITYLKNCTDEIQISYLTKTLGILYPSDEILLILAPYLKHKDNRVIANTIEGIEAVNSPKAFVLLSQMINHVDNRVRSNAVMAIGKFDKDQAFEVLLKMIQLKGKVHMQSSACFAIRELKESRLLPFLPPLFEDEFLLGEALKVFVEIGDDEAIRVLENSIKKCMVNDRKKKLEETLKKIRENRAKAAKAPPPKKIAPWMF